MASMEDRHSDASKFAVWNRRSFGHLIALTFTGSCSACLSGNNDDQYINDFNVIIVVASLLRVTWRHLGGSWTFPSVHSWLPWQRSSSLPLALNILMMQRIERGTGFAALILWMSAELLDLFQKHCPPRRFLGTLSWSSKALCYSVTCLGNASILSGEIAWVFGNPWFFPNHYPIPWRCRLSGPTRGISGPLFALSTLHHFTIPLSCRFNNPPWAKLNKLSLTMFNIQDQD